jgi:hypothetical protein
MLARVVSLVFMVTPYDTNDVTLEAARVAFVLGDVRWCTLCAATRVPTPPLSRPLLWAAPVGSPRPSVTPFFAVTVCLSLTPLPRGFPDVLRAFLLL